MKEIEILVEVYSTLEEAIKKLSKFKYVGMKKTIDTYYYDPKRENLKPNYKKHLNECLRTRIKNNKYYLTYKVDKFENDGNWLYSDEYETEVNNIEMLENIIEMLGLKKLLTIYNTKQTYETDKYEIVLETVKDLGCFLEVEYCTDENIDVKKIKQEIQQFINELNLNVSNELNMGKPEMMIKKNNIII